VLSYDLAMGSEREKSLHAPGPEAVEIVENFHGLLHSFTSVGLGHSCELVEKLP